MFKLKPLTPFANKFLAVIEMLLIMNQQALLHCVELDAESSKPNIKNDQQGSLLVLTCSHY